MLPLDPVAWTGMIAFRASEESEEWVRMGVLSWILFGAIAGWLANVLAGREGRSGCFANVAVGIVGAFIGGALFRALGGVGVTGFNLWSLLVAVVGAVILLAILELVRR